MGLMLSTPVHLDGVTDLHNAAFQRENSSSEEQLLRHLQGNDQHEDADMDRRESITSGIYEEIQEDEQSLDKSKNLISEPSTQAESSQVASPPPLPPRSPSQCFHLLSGRQRELAWFLGVHRNSNSCPASDVEDDELSRESSPVNGQDNNEVIMPRRKISEPSGNIPVQEQTRTATIGYSRRRRKNLESFLGVMEFGSKAKEINKTGANVLNKSLGALELVPRSEKDYADKEGQIRKRTYTEISRNRLDNVKFQETHRSSSAGALLSQDIVIEVPQNARGAEKSEDYLQTKANAKIEKEETRCEKYESRDNAVKNLPTVIAESKDFRCSPFDNEKIERCHSFSCSLQANKVDSSDKRDQLPKSPRSIAKRLQMMKPNLMKLILKEQTKQQELPSLRDKTKQVINRSLETLGWLGLATSQFEDSHCNVVVGGSSFYRSATCSGVDFQTERQNAQRRGAAAKVYKDRGKAYDVEKLERQKPDTNTTTSSCTTESMEEKLDIPSSINLLEGSAICSYHKSQLKKMDCGIGQTLEDIERLAKQELICEQICNMKMEDDSHYIPMRPLKKDRDEVIFGSKDLKTQSESVMPEEDYISMEGMTASTCKMDKNSYRESFDPAEASIHSSAYRNDAEIYMPMDGRKSTQEELAQR
ncbi:hypothetical protein J437_LFUL019624 [Ladona fulva]|nr:hypothetical protein J437_LFUL019624 [Ladona fulva]